MNENAVDVSAPLIGEKAPCFTAEAGGGKLSLKDFRKKWVILFTHAQDILPLFKTRTINYVLCKRSVKVVALGCGIDFSSFPIGGFIRQYLLRHSLTLINDDGCRITESYGISGDRAESEKGVFVIDPRGVLRMKLTFGIASEINFYEILRLVDALQTSDRKRDAKPAAFLKKRLGVVVKPTVIAERT